MIIHRKGGEGKKNGLLGSALGLQPSIVPINTTERGLPANLLRDLGEGFRNPSEVESQESRIHPGISDTARARPLLRGSPLLSRRNQREEYGKENCDENGGKNGYKSGDRFHGNTLRRVYAFPCSDGTFRAVRYKVQLTQV